MSKPSRNPCKHCGTEIPSAVEGEFCCTGCDYVYRLIHENGLDQYYSYRDATIEPVGARVFHDRDYSFLQKWLESHENSQTSPILEGNLSLQGISCIGCVWLIERLFQRAAGAVNIRIDAHTGKLSISWQRGVFDIARFAQETAQYGYTLGLDTRNKASSTRGVVTRLGLCAAFMMNAMLFTFPRYLGMEADFLLAGLFELLGVFFACLSMMVGGSYFIQRAYRSLRVRVLHIDIPIALGLILAFIGSLIGWVSGADDLLYFDFISVFVFLMLGGRWVQEWYVERSRNQWIDSNRFANSIEIFDDETNEWVERNLDQIKNGARIRVRAGDVLPVSSIIESGSVEMSLEWINGESEPVLYHKRARVPAGAANLKNEKIELIAEEPWTESLVKRLTDTRKGAVVRDPFMDKVLRRYLTSIIGIAAISGILWGLSGSWLKGLQVAISVLVISCPCAIGVAWPLAIERSVQFLRKRGVFIREPQIWTLLKNVRYVVFDKTGTLTLESPRLRDSGPLDRLSVEERSVLKDMVSRSLHPVSRSLREALGTQKTKPVECFAFRETPGVGLFGEVGTQRYFLGKSPENPGMTTFTLDGRILAKFEFSDGIRHDAALALNDLRKRDVTIEILSGDHPEKVEALRDALGSGSIFRAEGGMSPESKARRIQEIGPKQTMMIGDGVNDALAFQTAIVQGTPLVDRNLMVERAAFFFTGQGLKGVCALFDVSDALRSSGKAMFGFAVIYNALALLVSIAGWMSPLAAAVVMPLSSIFTLLITLSVLNRHLRESF